MSVPLNMQDPQLNSQLLLDEPRPSASYREVGEILRRRWVVIAATFAIVVAAGVAVTKTATPVYQATASLLVEPQGAFISQIDTSNPLSPLLAPRPEQNVDTQVRILQSQRFRDTLQKELGAVPSLSVSVVDKTNILEVMAEGPDPVLVGKAPNVLLDAYIKQTAEDSQEDIGHARKFTEEGEEKARRRMEEAERLLQRYKQSHGVTEITRNRDAVLGEVEALGGTYRQTQAELAVVLAQIASIKNRMRATPATMQSVVSADSDPVIRATEDQISALEIRRAELAERFEATATKANDPELNKLFPERYKGQAAPLAAVDAQIAVLRRKVTEQRGSINRRNEQFNPQRAALEKELGDAETRASGLSANAASVSRSLAAASAQSRNFPAWEMSIARLTRNLENARKDFTMYSQQREQFTLRDQIKQTRARVLDAATIPLAPVSPRPKQNLALSALLGLFFGICLALVLEYFDDRINTREEADNLLHLPNLGVIPQIKGSSPMVRDLSALSPVTDAYRGLRTNIAFAALDSAPRSLVVTSSRRGEGKSLTVANLATAMAMDGKRVIIVDADLRAPVQHTLFGLPAAPGLSDLLIGTHKISDIIQPTSTNRVSVIGAGTLPPNPVELLGSTAMTNFLDTVCELGDLVIFDTPPTLSLADSVLLGSQVDGVLFVVGAGEATRGGAQHGVHLLQRARANVLGVVMNKARVPAEPYYYGPNRPKRLTSVAPRVSASNGAPDSNGHEAPVLAGALPNALHAPLAANETGADKPTVETGKEN